MPFAQFDLKYNRPDLILERLGLATPELRDAYRSAYQKRLKRMGFTEAMLGDDLHLPEVRVTAPARFVTRQRILKLNVQANDSRYLLDRVNVYVNGVPQRPGTDYQVRGGALVFGRELRKDKVSGWRWALGAWGVGTYRKDDSVDVHWTRPDGTTAVAERLDIEQG